VTQRWTQHKRTAKTAYKAQMIKYKCKKYRTYAESIEERLGKWDAVILQQIKLKLLMLRVVIRKLLT